MRPSIGLHLALLIIHGWIIVASIVPDSQLPTISKDKEDLKYIKRKRNSTTNSASEFVTYNVIQPKIYHVQEKREIDISNIHPKTKNKNSTVVQNINDLTITFISGDQEYIVDLQLNHQLIPKGYFQKYHKKVSGLCILIKNVCQIFLFRLKRTLQFNTANILLLTYMESENE